MDTFRRGFFETLSQKVSLAAQYTRSKVRTFFARPTSNASNTMKTHFTMGGEYQVQCTVNSWRDSFQEGERLIFLSTAHSVYDSAYGYFFYDRTTGERRVYDVSDDSFPRGGTPERHPNDVFVLVGGWVRPQTLPHEPPALGTETLGIYSAGMQVFIPYLKDLLEGKEGIENWYEWWARNGGELAHILKRAEFIRMKHSPVSETERILGELGIPCRRGLRYGWLG
jgi:hypothetical protein